jgi:hypothetical protein
VAHDYPTGRPAIVDGVDPHSDVLEELQAIADQLSWGPGPDAAGEYLFNHWQLNVAGVWISAANRSVATPFWIPETANYDALVLEVTTADAAGTASVHRWNPHANGYPGARDIEDLVASVTVTSTGTKVCTFAASTEFVGPAWTYLVLENITGAARYRTSVPVHPRFHPQGAWQSSCISQVKGGYQLINVLATPWAGDLTPVAAPIMLALRRG